MKDLSHMERFSARHVTRLLDSKTSRTLFLEVLRTLRRNPDVDAVIWGGSTAENRFKEPCADLDLWVIGDFDPQVLQDGLHSVFGKAQNLLTRRGELLPWFGHLLQLYLLPECEFSIDLGLSHWRSASELYAGPKAAVLFFSGRRRIAMRSICPGQAAESVECVKDIIANCAKIRKCLCRGFLFDASEYLARARRALICTYAEKGEAHRFSRAERRAETWLSRDVRDSLYATHSAALSGAAIAEATGRLIDVALKQESIRDLEVPAQTLRAIRRSLLKGDANENKISS